jgi:hypothetical protein
MTDPSLDPIVAYLREHSGRYSLAVLREQLVRSGYDPARVDEALAVYQSEHPPAGRPHVFPKALLVLVINAVLTLGMIRAQSLKGDAASLISSFFLLLVGAELVGGIVACFPAKSRSWGLALLLGFALSVALGILALGGFCLYILSQGMGH